MSARSSHRTGFWKVALLGGADCAIPWNEPSTHKTANMIIDRTTTPFAMNLVFTDSPQNILNINSPYLAGVSTRKNASLARRGRVLVKWPPLDRKSTRLN